ncbi:hypothetical protein [Pseudothermotoga sp.]
MKRSIFSIVLLTFLVLSLVLFRTSKQRLKVFCDDSLKPQVVSALQEQGIRYEFDEQAKADLVVKKTEIVYKKNIYKLIWKENLSKRIEEFLRSYFDGARIERLSKGFLNERYKVNLEGTVYIVDVKAVGEKILQDMIKSILTNPGDFFENGFAVARMEAVLNGEKRIFFYDPKTDQFFIEDAGGS